MTSIGRKYLCFLIVADCTILAITHLGLLHGDGWNEWGICIYALLSLVLCLPSGLKSLRLLSCWCGPRPDHPEFPLLLLLTVLALPYGIFLALLALTGNEPIRLSLCLLFPILHERLLNRLAGQAMAGLLRMRRLIQQ